MKKIITSIILILTLNSCFLGITGAPHSHLYREITGNSTIKVNVHCMYLNKTFEIRNSNPNDSLFIQSSSFKNPSEKRSLNRDIPTDSIRYYNWRIGDIRYHKNILKDTIEIIKITKKGNQIAHKFVAE
ncbi:MAG TPA: hypothetical protein VNJ50_11635 [Gelidibacter sp.]|uniref:hypothetical protein n=1 Tax=Gelidibacter sp. TaxID=2018083 RepID=UPI002B5BCB41|nr:hypothetical protein [Gelidibacter sp.]HXJ99493.1 hypothetical protein [Gelidibacter sp.]